MPDTILDRERALGVDESLLLGWNRSRSKAQTHVNAALSASSTKKLLEDPHLWYLKKVEGRSEPTGINLALGTAAHEGMERLYETGSAEDALSRVSESLAGEWESVDDPSIWVNESDPTNPRHSQKTRKEISLGEAEESLAGALRAPLQWISWTQYNPYSPLQAQSDALRGDVPMYVECSLGQLAKEAGLPHGTTTGYNRVHHEHGDYLTSRIGGVALKGFVDFACGEPGTPGSWGLDHKAVGQVCNYYPSRSGYTNYGPSYDPLQSCQIDFYQGSGGFGRFGFHFLLKRPQHVPEGEELWRDWADENEWDPGSDLLPFGWLAEKGKPGASWICAWRPSREDSPRWGWTLEHTRRSAADYARDAAEFLTEALILLEAGVDPEICFPPGDPEDIARKACPFCHFNGNGCASPREPNDSTEYFRAWDTREELCEDNSLIRERRGEWARWREQLELPPVRTGPVHL